jgi:exosortase/archaeosortase family protein
MDKSSEKLIDIFVRYFLLILIALPNLYIFYLIFTPLTVYPVYFLLNLLFDCSVYSNIINISGITIEVIKACVAGSAYYLLLIFNLSTPKIKLRKRITMIFVSFVALLILNILRIFFLSILFVSNSNLFDFTHKLFWYLLSILFVIGIWLIEVKVFKIKEIPFYSDILFIYKKSILKKKINKT